MSSLNFQKLYPLVALGLLAGATIWLERATRPGEEKAASGPRHDPDLMVQAFTLRRFDKNGAPQYVLTGSRMVHFPDDDSSVVARPHLLFTGKGSPINLTADQGTGYDQGARVFLEGDVKVLRAGDAQRAPMDFRSSTLTVWPDEERAETRSPLVMTQGGTVVHANGMKAQNLIGSLYLDGGVTARLQHHQANPTPAPSN